ncbi:hypothetical protein Ddye_020539 [Dipteronia dyeriana]|uniref:Uncharacterized protein n=1 Tax=Dipteronia dyeriana TaxID=168575 RepID=A0AAD9WVG6_9ROSI|nr:hypothetical protein Ddye_020539 [Dipteronia dyeriana]
MYKDKSRLMGDMTVTANKTDFKQMKASGRGINSLTGFNGSADSKGLVFGLNGNVIFEGTGSNGNASFKGDCVKVLVTRPRGGVNGWLHWLPVSLHKKANYLVKRICGDSRFQLTSSVKNDRVQNFLKNIKIKGVKKDGVVLDKDVAYLAKGFMDEASGGRGVSS